MKHSSIGGLEVSRLGLGAMSVELNDASAKEPLPVGSLDEPSGREHLGDAIAQGVEGPRRLAVTRGC
jgi:aryl-alcohol dehydrogenase-like predicted oxidoreductase